MTMKTFLLGAALAAMTLPLAAPVLADPPRDHGRGDHRDDRHDNGRGWGRGGNDRGNGWQNYRNYDWNRPDRSHGGGYDAARYYRDGRGYQERRIGRNDRIYRGSNGRYYCRRTDGTTGLIIGGALGGLLGNSLASGGSSTVATLLGAGGGALLGQSIDRGNVRCR
jgi:hypothetical protein